MIRRDADRRARIERIAMTVPVVRLTAEELARLPARTGPIELVRAVLVEMAPAGDDHG
jgi:hypothetical protein